MTNSIPASQLVSVVPSVLSAGGDQLVLNGVFLTEDLSIPLGSVMSFATQASVAAFFGAESPEAALANDYFNGFEGATVIPSQLYFASYNASAVGAFLRSASLASISLAQLQALTGTVIVTVDGRVVTSASINLSSATSFTNAAALIAAGLQTTGNVFSGTGHIDDGASSAGTLLTISAVSAGALHVGDVITGAGVTAGTTIVSFGTGTGGVGTYNVSASQLVASEALTSTLAPTVAYDAQRRAFVITSPTTGITSTIGYASGTLSSSIFLTQATGAVISQGAASAAPASFMDQIVRVTQNWATFMTVWEPDVAGKTAFSNWVTAQQDHYAYAVWDTSIGPTASEDDETCIGRVTMDFDGVIPLWGPANKAAFLCGMIASINFAETNGRITAAYKSQAGLTADVTDATVAQNLLANGYNFYGDYATANDNFQFLQNGQISGAWNWIDSYVNQIKLNSDLQLAFLDLLTSVKSIPYNQRGYNLLRAAAMDPINSALNFGSIQPGVDLSARQIAEIDNAAGQSGVGRAVSQVGYYLQIKPADSNTRGQRGSPPMTLWYADGGSIQKINLASIDVQ